MSDAGAPPRFARALVTGGNGYIASHLTRHLAGRGVETSVLLRPGGRLDRLGDAAGAVTVLHGGDTTDGLREQLARARPEVVFHLAATYIAAPGPGDHHRIGADNVLLTARICPAAMEAAIGSAARRDSGCQYV